MKGFVVSAFFIAACVANVEQDPRGSCVCGAVNGNTGRIVGGTEAAKNKYPYQAALVMTGGNAVFCGGTVITDRHIMTAAHCTDGMINMDFFVRLGEHDTTLSNDGAVDYEIEKIINDPTYNKDTVNNDFAILKLKKPITFTKNIQPACLPADASKDYAGYKAVVSGWGTLASGGKQPNKLMEVELPVLANKNCGDYVTFGQITSNMLCAGYLAGGKDACQGDSGGPLVTFKDGPGTLIGVVSWGSGCADKNFPGVYARVTSRLAWIKQNIADGNICPASTG